GPVHGTQVSQEVEAIDPGQAEVEHHDVVVLARERRAGALPVADPVDGEAVLAQAEPDGLADHGVVLDQQQSHLVTLRQKRPTAGARGNAPGPQADGMKSGSSWCLRSNCRKV